MKIQTVDTYRCDNQKCRKEFSVSDKKSGIVSLMVDNARTVSTREAYCNLNGVTFCHDCTENILSAMGR